MKERKEKEVDRQQREKEKEVDRQQREKEVDREKERLTFILHTALNFRRTTQDPVIFTYF